MMNAEMKKRVSPVVAVIILFGIISMLGDVVYESARSANSQYLNLLGFSAATIGLVFGIGEFLGYFLRLIAGIISDKSGKHWTFMFLGYGMLLVVPLMGFSLKWNLLIVLILMERIGKALRSPAKDTILSAIADKKVGVGFAFGLQEALDQIGAFIGPLIFTMVFYFSGKNGIAQYQSGYKLLIIPFVILMIVLTLIFCKVNKEQLIPTIKSNEYQSENLQPIFWIYAAFTLFCALGFVNFSIIGYHLKANNLMSDGNITLLYAAAMIVDAAAALLVGNNYDRLKKKTALKTGGLTTLMIIPILTVFLPFLTLSETPLLIITGMMAFGIVMGTHETIMRSAIADITPFRKRGTGYGVFNSVYGFALLSGSALMGWLYDLNQTAIIIGLVCLAEVVALLVFFKMRRMARTKGNGA